MTRATMKRLRVGDVVQSAANLDKGAVLVRNKHGLEIRWRGSGIREFVLFSECGSLIERRPSLFALDRVQRAAMLRRQVIPPREEVPTSEQQRIRGEIAELAAWKRANPSEDAAEVCPARHRRPKYTAADRRSA